VTGKRRFRVRLVLEGLVVVSSILLAFALDAWWDEHERLLALIPALEASR